MNTSLELERFRKSYQRPQRPDGARLPFAPPLVQSTKGRVRDITVLSALETIVTGLAFVSASGTYSSPLRNKGSEMQYLRRHHRGLRWR
jgi:hypothetical protein